MIRFMIIVCVTASVLLLLPERPYAASFLGRPWACPNLEALERADEARREIDQEMFDESGCVAVLPNTHYRMMRCDQRIPERYTQEFSYSVPRTTELPKFMCEVSVSDGHVQCEKCLIRLADVILLKPN